jgi:hypothetical protein
MNTNLLKKHIQAYKVKLAANSEQTQVDKKERQERMEFYQGWTADQIKKMTPDDVAKYISRLWAMLIWGNKQYVVNKIIDTNGLEKFRQELALLVWGQESVAKRWDRFRENIKSVGPAMMSEILCHVHPESCMLWNRRAYVGLNYLEVSELPKYDYQLTGERYEKLCRVCSTIADEIQKAGAKDITLLWVDYFIWSELQVADTLAGIGKTSIKETETKPVELEKDKKNFVHNEIRDKIADIGQWLGLQTDIEKKVADGAVVDAVWEVTIGNMGRVIYVFEVQTSGSIDSLLMNLLRALNNSAVQGVVAVSDADQLEKIKREAASIHALSGKLKCWNYEEIMKVHDALSGVYAAINALGLVPQGF